MKRRPKAPGEFHAGKSTPSDNEPSRIISLAWRTEKAGMNLRSWHPRRNCITVEDAAATTTAIAAIAAIAATSDCWLVNRDKN